MIDLTKYLLKEFTEDSGYVSIKFFRSNKAHGYVAWLTIMKSYLEGKECSVDDIVKITEKYSSRRSVVSFLDSGQKKGFLEKITSSNDKRKVVIIPTKISIVDFIDWGNKFKKSIR